MAILPWNRLPLEKEARPSERNEVAKPSRRRLLAKEEPSELKGQASEDGRP